MTTIGEEEGEVIDNYSAFSRLQSSALDMAER